MGSTSRLLSKLLLLLLAVSVGRAVWACPAAVSFSSPSDTAEQLLVKLFKRSGDNFLIEPCLPCERRISVSLSGAPMETALKRICESADLAWKKQGNVYVIAPSRSMNFRFASPSNLQTLMRLSSATTVPTARMTARPGLDRTVTQRLGPDMDLSRLVLLAPGLAALPPTLLHGTLTFNDGKRVYGALASEERSTFSCPHCKRSLTVIGRNHLCAKCGRGFQRDWVFCPFDGAKRVAVLDEWKVCPFCARGVK